MESETAGDPISGLKWTRKTTDKISKQIKSFGIPISSTTVGKILKQLGFSLKSNVKKISNGGKSVTIVEQEKRNSQFEYINKLRCQSLKEGFPEISIDTKKKELIGNFKNPGTRYKRVADLTNARFFIILGKAALYGVYNPAHNKAFVSIGMFVKEKKTIGAEFAVESIERWLINEGVKKLVLADRYRTHMCKITVINIIFTVCHFPPLNGIQK